LRQLFGLGGCTTLSWGDNLIRVLLTKRLLSFLKICLSLVIGALVSVHPFYRTDAASLDQTFSNDDYKTVVRPPLHVLASRGNTRAQTELGFAYETGVGVPQNFDLAAQWYWRAANRGNPMAQYLLGLMYDKGRGVPLDTIVAQKWLILATASAPIHQREYFMRIRDAVASKMSADEIAQAQDLAFQWTLTHRRWKHF
jgi:uncharacterized protein